MACSPHELDAARCRRRRWIALAAAVGVPAAVAVLYWIPPRDGSIYPPCVFRKLTGLHCPGCGTGRCLHALLHGELRQAIAYNVITVAVVPVMLFWAVRAWSDAIRGRLVVRRRIPGWGLAIFAAVLIVFAILRNLPIAPFNLLAPHTL
jgi:hypothetical protein